MDPRISVVIATRDRRGRLGATLDWLRALPESPRVILVDNGSRDGTADLVRDAYPEVRLVALGRNLGAAARNVGVREADSAYVAFSDDDSWWASGALRIAADRLDDHPTLALVAARVLVEPSGRIDPTCLEMASSPLPRHEGLPGSPVLGFLACGAVVRRSAFLEVGGFEARFGVGGEEELLAIDLAASGWGLCYCDDVVAHHHPVASGPRPGRRRVQYRNALWSAWLRRPLWSAMHGTARLAAAGYRDPDARAALRDALSGLPWVIRRRRPIPPEVERALLALGR
ncbi:glycosyltransferase family 2 protein [Tautonia plasticadhaerens]|uniref:N-acetylglucosaminyl-diphospho-decaprenol L-rhamnosyltransferase n=1 Tax=Tautonia plasticadhaerens TaxID=2527974 RepID=A0A518H5Z6_9BACT|nr:N-acetylglucosaminyl-diphospho-decaprenol L-rhamnosyltransferase [Tautonia plasticadhaerens]